MATAGHAGYVGISTAGARTEQDLHYHLDFLDKLHEPLAVTTLNWGAENVNWRMVDGFMEMIPADDIPNGWHVVDGLNQFRMDDTRSLPRKLNPIEMRQDAVMEDNLQYAIHNPVLPLRSETWTSREQSLNQLIDDAVINYVMGNIDKAGFDEQVARWYNEGGQDAINEFGAAYAAIAR
jgi:putative aldouronate transport system substrate-binding protein